MLLSGYTITFKKKEKICVEKLYFKYNRKKILIDSETCHRPFRLYFVKGKLFRFELEVKSAGQITHLRHYNGIT